MPVSRAGPDMAYARSICRYALYALCTKPKLGTYKPPQPHSPVLFLLHAAPCAHARSLSGSRDRASAAAIFAREPAARLGARRPPAAPAPMTPRHRETWHGADGSGSAAQRRSAFQAAPRLPTAVEAFGLASGLGLASPDRQRPAAQGRGQPASQTLRDRLQRNRNRIIR